MRLARADPRNSSSRNSSEGRPSQAAVGEAPANSNPNAVRHKSARGDFMSKIRAFDLCRYMVAAVPMGIRLSRGHRIESLMRGARGDLRSGNYAGRRISFHALLKTLSFRPGAMGADQPAAARKSEECDR